ncbi:MAG: TIGR04222 domain-containing membrane protein [Verrucomicrobiaceae bacterium]|nr:TIGR04222 domain-containing membrane protein [Verrucomicrobiaceae bacterium]
MRPDEVSDPYEVAMLGGGERRALDAALASLFARRMIEVQSHGPRQPATLHLVPGIIDSRLHAVEQRVLQTLPQDLRGLRKLFAPLAEKLRRNLESSGLVLSSGQRSQVQLIVAAPLVLMMVIGVVKVFIGLERERPVAFLVIALVVSLIVLCVVLSKIARRTPAGEAVWKRMAKPTIAPRLKEAEPALPETGHLAAMAVALAGTHALAGAGYEPLYQTVHRPQASSSSGCGSSGCGASGCGGGGGGDSGGGDGGGGCGGCGGGGD